MEAAQPEPGLSLLDVAAGSGNVAIPAAQAGARVVAADLTPELLEVGRADAERLGLEVEWREADAEAMPFADGAFDVVVSCVGVMFAPHHERAAAELLRVCRPGGRIALVAWTPEGFIGRMFAAMRPFVPPPPPGAQPPPRWGDEGHVRSLLGEGAQVLSAERRRLPVTAFASPQEFLEFFRTCYGPTIAAFAGLREDPDRTRELSDALLELAAEFATGQDPLRMDWEYLLLVARRAG
nr:class I SAM-dependent methyltransferase [Kineococcus vitellinus]